MYYFFKGKLKEKKEFLEFEYLSTYYYAKYNISEYTVDVDEQFHTIYFCECGNTLDFINFRENTDEEELKKLVENRNYVLYCGLVCDEDQVNLDCTEYLRRFCFYFSGKNSQLTWNMVLEHISLIENILLDTKKYKLVLYKNDEQLTEMEITVDESLLNSMFSIM